MRLGPYTLDNSLLLAPMAGVTDKPFRQLCRMYGAGLAVSEMVASDPAL
ncbi:MAG: tRNA-dihydrouridine synthase, partial [Gammaproteobacteria bacterium]